MAQGQTRRFVKNQRLFKKTERPFYSTSRGVKTRASHQSFLSILRCGHALLVKNPAIFLFINNPKPSAAAPFFNK